MSAEHRHGASRSAPRWPASPRRSRRVARCQRATLARHRRPRPVAFSDRLQRNDHCNGDEDVSERFTRPSRFSVRMFPSPLWVIQHVDSGIGTIMPSGLNNSLTSGRKTSPTEDGRHVVDLVGYARMNARTRSRACRRRRPACGSSAFVAELSPHLLRFVASARPLASAS
jgi:hypothetical protein